MKILIALNSFKGTISSTKAGKAVNKEIKKLFKGAKILIQAVSDGGDGFIECLKTKKAKIIRKKVSGPLYKKVDARYILEGKKAYIEIAQACGIKYLKKDELSPLTATTYGVGELVCDALQKGASHIFLGLGGTASSDGGYGMAKALGFKFLDKNGNEISDCVSEFIKIKKIIPPDKKNFKKASFFAITDVRNPLLGKNGSARIFGPQKGADKKEIEIIERGLKNLALKIRKLNNIDITKFKGGGAAGGLAAGLKGCLKAKIIKGSFFMVKKLDLIRKIKNSDLIITGEGKFDKTSFMGKIPGLIYKLAKKYKKKIIIISAINECEMKDENVLNITLNKYFPEKYSMLYPQQTISRAIKISRIKIKKFINKK